MDQNDHRESEEYETKLQTDVKNQTNAEDEEVMETCNGIFETTRACPDGACSEWRRTRRNPGADHVTNGVPFDPAWVGTSERDGQLTVASRG
jgi:hypothetical protein